MESHTDADGNTTTTSAITNENGTTRNMNIEKLKEEKSKLEQKRKDKEQRLSVLEQQIKAQEKLVSIDQRNKRTHRLCVYGGTVEKYLPPDQYSEQGTVHLLEQIFNLKEVQNLINK